MRHCITIPILFAALLASAITPSFSTAEFPPTQEDIPHKAPLELKRAAFQVLDAKCNVCHRKRNPFMVFSMKNMEKRAAKVYKQVFVTERMPKGDRFTLSQEERSVLTQWIKTQNIH